MSYDVSIIIQTSDAGRFERVGDSDLLRRTLAACRRHDRCTLAVSW